MMAFQMLIPVIASVLYVIVFQKAGFKGAMLVFCAAPLLAAVLGQVLIGMMGMGFMGAPYMLTLFVLGPLSLLPLLILAFKTWPPVAVSNSRSEK